MRRGRRPDCPRQCIRTTAPISAATLSRGHPGRGHPVDLSTQRRSPLRRPHRAPDRHDDGAGALLPGSSFANPGARQGYDPARFAAMTFREFECALGWEIAGRYNQQIHSALLRPPIALWREHEDSLALRMPKDRMAFWVSFLPDAHRTLRPDGIWLHGIPYWSNVLSSQVGRGKRELLVKFDPRDVSHIFVQHPNGHFIEARARSLGFPAISLREWKKARKALGVKGREERNDEQITKTALAHRKLIDEAIAKTTAARRKPQKAKNTGDMADFGSMTGIDLRIPTVLELVERQRDRKTRPSDG